MGNLFAQDGGVGGAADKGAFKVPDILNAETITVQNDRDFSAGNIGNWTAINDGAGSVAYDTTDIGGTDNKQMLLTVNGDSYLLANLDLSNISVVANTLHRISFNAYVPATNTNKNIEWLFQSVTGDVPGSGKEIITGDEWVNIVGYNYIAADLSGDLRINLDGVQTNGDKLYIDDISIKPVDISWGIYTTNAMSIDEAIGDGGALKITGDGSNTLGGFIYLSNSNGDLTTDLTIDKKYILIFTAKADLGSAVIFRVNNGAGYEGTAPIAENFTIYKTVFTAKSTTNAYIQFRNFDANEKFWLDHIAIYPYDSSKSAVGMGMGMGMLIK